MKKSISSLICLFLCQTLVFSAPTLIPQNLISKTIDSAQKVKVENLKANVEFVDPTVEMQLKDNLKNGDNVYINDRYPGRATGFFKKYADVSDFAGLQYIVMDDNVWWYLETGEKFLEFDIDRDATVYIAFKRRLDINQMFNPTHFLMDKEGGWKYTGKDISVYNGKTNDTYFVFARTFPKGHVILPGNNSPGLSVSVGSQYTVFIGNPISQPLPNYVAKKSYEKGTIPAFPGAEGGGMWATGGRGGEVYEVTNLLDYNPKTDTPIHGSFRDAVSKSNRTIVFKVSGNIEAKVALNVNENNLTIAGQTSPGGICVKNWPLSFNGSNIIARFLRSRPGDNVNGDFDGLGGAFMEQVILDHMSGTWSTDEAASFRYSRDFTLQWSILGESNLHATYMQSAHGFGGIWAGTNATYHHNLLAHNVSRMPRFNQGPLDFRNNIVYDWGYKAEYGDYNYANFVGNYYKPGISTLNVRFSEPLPIDSWRGKALYLTSNIMAGHDDITKNNLLGLAGLEKGKKYAFATEEVEVPDKVRTQTAQAAFDTVVKYAGSSAKYRDANDDRIIHETVTGTGALKYTSIPDPSIITDAKKREEILNTIKNHKATQVVYEWPVATTELPPLDSDHDGMPDAWEIEHKLDPKNPADRNNDFTGDGYTNLEKYINELAAPYMPKEEDYKDKDIVFNTVKREEIPFYKDLPKADDTYKVYVNDKKVVFENSPIMKDNQLLVPLQDMYYSLIYSVVDNSKEKTVKIFCQTKNILLKYDDKNAIVNGVNKAMDVAPTMIDGVLYVPLNFAVESTGGKIIQNASEKRYDIAFESILVKSDMR